ncbi:Enoyl-CoA hydratase/carnithine racemase [Syntrophobacter sp. SbD1]|nr:Enoyl-CoA hydratase/carnithine racemase [Syntrophobacter sp. SbD1]
MTTKEILTTDNDFFSSSMDNGILVVREKQHILHLTQDLKDIFSFYDYLDSVLSSKSYRAFVLFARSEQSGHIEQSRFLSKILSDNLPGKLGKELDRFVNVVNRLFVTLSTLNRITVFAGRGITPLFYLNIGLAHDYRFVAEDSVFENLNSEMGLITKGSGYFLPRLLGIRKATEVLQWKSFSAEDALQLGLVDRVVPVSKLEEETMRFVQRELALSSSMLGIRKLLKCDLKELERSLDLEDNLIKERLNSVEFRELFATNRKKSVS